jgi:hypothetical protein
MTPTLRRYKNQLAVINKKFGKTVREHAIFNPRNPKSHFSHPGVVTLRCTDILYEAYITYYAVLTNSNLKYVDSDGVIYIGIDLNQPVNFNMKFVPFNTPEDYLGSQFLDSIIPAWGDPKEPIASLVREELVSRGLLEPSQEFTRRRSASSFHREDVMPSKYFQEFKRDVDKMTSNLSCTMSLKDGEFPRCPDRKIFPFLVLNTDGNIVQYFVDDVDSYRKGRGTSELGLFLDTISYIITAAFNVNPFKFIKVDIPSNSYIKSSYVETR